MLTYLRAFFRKNKRKLLITTGIISALYLSTKFLQKKLIEFQERIKEENFTKEQIKRRFVQTQKDCYMTFVSLVGVLNEPIFNSLPVEKIFKELQMIRLEKQLVNNESKLGTSTIVSEDYPSESGTGAVSNNELASQGVITYDSNKKSKADLWAELKTVTIARFLSVIYAQSVLLVLIHIQLNILSRRAYISSAIDLASKTQGIKLYDEEEAAKLEQEDTEGEKRFLSLTYYLMSKGNQSIVERVTTAVKAKFNDINVRQEFAVSDFFELVKSTAIGEVNLNYLDTLGLTEDADEAGHQHNTTSEADEKFENLKKELISYLTNEDAKAVLESIVLQSISQTEKNVASTLESAKLATLLIQLTKNIPNNNNDVQLQVTESLNDLSSSVYSNF